MTFDETGRFEISEDRFAQDPQPLSADEKTETEIKAPFVVDPKLESLNMLLYRENCDYV